MHREFGIIYGRSGRANATKRAIEHLTIAHSVLPHDAVCAKKLSDYLLQQGKYDRAVEVLQPFMRTENKYERETLLPVLLEAYEKQPSKYLLEIAELKRIIYKQ